MNRTDNSNSGLENGSDDGISGQSDTSGRWHGVDEPESETASSDDVTVDIVVDENVTNLIKSIQSGNNELGSCDLDITRLYDNIIAALGELGLVTGVLAIYITDNAGMTELHSQYCGIAEPTDVLTFDLTDDLTDHSQAEICEEDSYHSINSQIVVCFDVACEQAQVRGNDTVNNEILLYVLHGILHCLGYDDHDDEDFRIMHQREDEILEAIGVGKIFDTE